MNEKIVSRLIEKLIEDTKAGKLKWNKKINYSLGTPTYSVNIDEIGKIFINKSNNDEIWFDIFEKSKEDGSGKSMNNLRLEIDYQSDYYVDLMRLYYLANSSYKKRFIGSRLEKGISEYINRAD
ncbi:MAG: hypothetical protein FWH10_00130 [Oscillospiraceae bacterium]|nr:hypothetical protein [Oscillospiraceae bacterium]